MNVSPPTLRGIACGGVVWHEDVALIRTEGIPPLEAATSALPERVLAGTEVRREADEATVAAAGTELITGPPVDGRIVVPAAGVAVIHEAGG